MLANIEERGKGLWRQGGNEGGLSKRANKMLKIINYEAAKDADEQGRHIVNVLKEE